MKEVKIIDPERWTYKAMQEARGYDLPDDCHGGTVIDCGSNVGGFELVYHDRFDRFICFDVCEENIELLRKNLSGYLDKIETNKRACYSEDGAMIDVMAHSDEFGHTDYFGNSGNFGIVEYVNPDKTWGWKKENTVDRIESISIESIIDQHKPIKLLKIDIEGSEFKFLLEKDLSAIEYIVGEFHFADKPIYSELIKHVEKTHEVVSIRGELIVSFRRKK